MTWLSPECDARVAIVATRITRRATGRTAGARRLVGVVAPVDPHAEHSGDGHVTLSYSDGGDIIVRYDAEGAPDGPYVHFELQLEAFQLAPQGVLARPLALKAHHPDVDRQVVDRPVVEYVPSRVNVSPVPITNVC